jgi:hypothetical protein
MHALCVIRHIQTVRLRPDIESLAGRVDSGKEFGFGRILDRDDMDSALSCGDKNAILQGFRISKT